MIKNTSHPIFLSGRHSSKIISGTCIWEQEFRSDWHRKIQSTINFPTTYIITLKKCRRGSEYSQNVARQKKIDELSSQIENFLSLPLNWDGYDAQPLSRHIADDAITFLQSLPQSWALPQAMPSADNEILMIWENEHAKAMISFFGDSLYHLFFKKGTHKEYHDDIVLKPGSIPQEILTAISMAE